MTLNTRNKLLLFFSVISCACTFFFIISLIRILIQNPQNADFLFALPQTSFFYALITPNYPAVFFSFLFFSLFVPTVGLSVYFNFEKTQSLEVLFFSAALIGILCESLKLCIPLLNLSPGYSPLLRFIGQASFFGRMEILLVLIVQAVLSGGIEGRESDRYLGIIIIAALIFAAIIPVNTTSFYNYMNIEYGFRKLFDSMRFVFTLCSFLALFLSAKSKESSDYKKASLDFLFICCGYIVLLHCTTYVLLIVGASLLSVGTFRFLKNMYRYYMWK